MTVHYKCPTCGTKQECYADPDAEIQVACEFCKTRIDIMMSQGKVKRLRRSEDAPKTFTSTDVYTPSTNPPVSIGTIYGSVSFGGDVNVTNIYNETIKIIDDAKDVSNEQKSQAKKVLDYVKDNASPFLPIIAEAIKKALGLG